MVSIHPVARHFDAAAADYERARPRFPREAIDQLARRLGLQPGRRVLDLAAGTGKLTRDLATTGADVVAVEPLAGMREQLRAAAPGVEVLEGTAEAIPLPAASLDAATVAQAFHWFDRPRAYAELARVLRPGGGLALLWNTRDDVGSELQARVEAVVKPHRDEAAAPEWELEYDHAERSRYFGDWENWEHPWEQEFDRDLLRERFRSVSFIAGMEPARQREVLDGVVAAADGLPERFPFPYVTEIFICFRHTAAE
ncbi:MAG: class I SAM-dependent methyltransferase [Actinobacteria bacterium]|nr:class I SAM-dependent methyltransferase [Actinomycetota bacterium]